METDLAYEVLADYSLQETPFYEAPTPTAAVSVNLYPPPNNTNLQTSHLQSRNIDNINRRYDSAYDLSPASSMLTGKMQLHSTSSSAGTGTNVGSTALHGGMHHTAGCQAARYEYQVTVDRKHFQTKVENILMDLETNEMPRLRTRQGCDGDSGPIQLKQEPLDDGPIRNIQKVPSLSDLSDPEASLVKY
uniref:Uncharacterized protein n=1 Tax=Anopheles culicifacies TaxID=139723 RepID=A0A182MQP4_9DIPT